MSRTLRVIAICGFGLGSSEILVLNVQKALESLGIKDYHVEAGSLALSTALDADIIVTSTIFVKDIQERLKDKKIPVVGVKSYVNLKDITDKLASALKEIGWIK